MVTLMETKTFSMKYPKLVEKFHKAFGHAINKVTDLIPLKTRQQRVNLMFEELEEFAEASDVQETFAKRCACSHEQWSKTRKKDGDDVNKVEEADALGDLTFVVDGTVLACGHHDNFDDIFTDIYNSNMSKMCANMQEVEDTIKYYIEERGMDESNISHKPEDDKFIVFRVEDDKILKNVHYKPVDLKKYI